MANVAAVLVLLYPGLKNRREASFVKRTIEDVEQLRDWGQVPKNSMEELDALAEVALTVRFRYARKRLRRHSTFKRGFAAIVGVVLIANALLLPQILKPENRRILRDTIALRRLGGTDDISTPESYVSALVVTLQYLPVYLSFFFLIIYALQTARWLNFNALYYTYARIDLDSPVPLGTILFGRWRSNPALIYMRAYSATAAALKRSPELDNSRWILDEDFARRFEIEYQYFLREVAFLRATASTSSRWAQIRIYNYLPPYKVRYQRDTWFGKIDRLLGAETPQTMRPGELLDGLPPIHRNHITRARLSARRDVNKGRRSDVNAFRSVDAHSDQAAVQQHRVDQDWARIKRRVLWGQGRSDDERQGTKATGIA